MCGCVHAWVAILWRDGNSTCLVSLETGQGLSPPHALRAHTSVHAHRSYLPPSQFFISCLCSKPYPGTTVHLGWRRNPKGANQGAFPHSPRASLLCPFQPHPAFGGAVPCSQDSDLTDSLGREALCPFLRGFVIPELGSHCLLCLYF